MKNQLVKKISSEISFQGFTKKVFTWVRGTEQIYYIIEIQPSKNNSDTSQKFTINIGIFVPEVYELTWQKKPSSIIHEYDCILRKRVSYFMKSTLDKWWTLKNQEDIVSVKSEIEDIFYERIVPFFDDLNSLDKLTYFLNADKSVESKYPLYKIQLACLNYIIGNKEISLEILKKIFNDNTWGIRAQEVNKILHSMSG